MNNSLKRTLSLLLILILAVGSLVVPVSAAEEWVYANSLPSYVTSDKYIIQYNNIYRTTRSSSPGSEWTNVGFAYSEFVNRGEPYTSDFELPTSETRVLLSYWYYHFCSSSMGTWSNFALSGPYTHYDGIAPGNFYEARSFADYDDSRYTIYQLRYYDGTPVYCQSGYTCDGRWGSHGKRSYDWYKEYRYQDRVKVDYYNYQKQSGWTSSRDGGAYSYTVRYKQNHTHSYSAWMVSKKATLTEDGLKYRACNSCSSRITAKIEKLSSVKLSAMSFAYNGKAKTPFVTVTDSKNSVISSENYSVSYSKGRKKVGTYKVTVKFGGAYYSGAKTLSFKIVPAAVKDLAATAGKGRVSLKWSKAKGAESYKIYSYNRTTKKLKLLNETTGTSYKLSSLKSSNSYSFVVKAGKKVGKTAYLSSSSNIATAQPFGTPTRVKKLSASSKTSSSVRLTWEKASGNSVTYIVYRYNASSGKYTRLGTTSSSGYTVKKLKANTKYSFAVRSYSSPGGGYYGKMSPIFTVRTEKPLSSPNVNGVSLSTEKKLFNVRVGWKTSGEATGYEIYRSTTGKSNSYSLIKRLDSSSAKVFRDTSVMPCKTYYYKVRSYKTRGSQTAYGKFSKAAKVVTYSAWTEKPTVATFSFNFSNSNDSFDYPKNYRIPLSSYQIIFGKTALADSIYREDSREAWGGSCHGMSAAAALMNVRSSGVTVKSFNPSVSSVEDLHVTDRGSLGISVKTFIEALQVSQYAEAIDSYKRKVYYDYNGFLSAVKRAELTGKPVIAGIHKCVDKIWSGHAILAYGAEKVSPYKTNVKVYDCNYPKENRILTIFTDSSGRAVGWEYDMQGETWGTTAGDSCFEYVQYDLYSTVWTNRKKFTSSLSKTNTLFVNSGNISIFDEDGALVAEVQNGKLKNKNGEITIVGERYSSTDDLMLHMPTDETYTVVNNDAGVEVFEATMVNVERSASVSTQADCVTFTVSDSEEKAEAAVEAQENEKLSISLELENGKEEGSLEVKTVGDGNEISAASVGDETVLKNCEDAVVKVDGDKLSKRQISSLHAD